MEQIHEYDGRYGDLQKIDALNEELYKITELYFEYIEALDLLHGCKEDLIKNKNCINGLACYNARLKHTKEIKKKFDIGILKNKSNINDSDIRYRFNSTVYPQIQLMHATKFGLLDCYQYYINALDGLIKYGIKHNCANIKDATPKQNKQINQVNACKIKLKTRLNEIIEDISY